MLRMDRLVGRRCANQGRVGKPAFTTIEAGSSSTTGGVVDTVHMIDEPSRIVSVPDPKTSLHLRPVWD